MTNQPTRITLLDEIRETHSSDRWDDFFSEYGKLLRHWLVKQNISTADAEDIRQETMLAVINNLPNFVHNGRTGAFRLWLKRILTNRINQMINRRDRQREVGDLERVFETLADESTEISAEFRKEHEQFVIERLLKKAEAQFSTERVALFRSLMIDEVPIEQLSHKHSITTGNIRVQQHRILKWLRDYGRGIIDL